MRIFLILCGLFFSASAFANDYNYTNNGNHRRVQYRYEGNYADRYQRDSTMRYPSEIQRVSPNPNQGFVNNGVYMAFRSGYSIYDFSDVDSSGDFSKGNYMFSFASGMRHQYLRLEAEYINRGTVSYRTDGAKHSFRNDTYNVNFYIDFMPFYIATPYISAGGGVTRVTYNAKNTSKGNIKRKKTLLTGNIGGGIAFRIDSGTNIDLGYRYHISDDFDIDKNMDMNYHDIYIGVRYTF